MRVWPVWMFGVSAGILWGLPRAPYYHVDLPYIYYLGGCALVALYVGMGFLSLGSYIIVTEVMHSHGCRQERREGVLYGSAAVVLGAGFWAIYHVLMELSVSIS